MNKITKEKFFTDNHLETLIFVDMKQFEAGHYPIFTGSTALESFSQFLATEIYANRKFFVLVDENTLQYCFTRLITNVSVLQECEVIEIPSGEDNKDLSIVEGVLHTLADFGADRNSVLINLGGGVICDMGGFSASIYQRGIQFIHVPTTLLAMADASVGGKTGVNLAHLKNQIGTFTQPEAVIIDPEFLTTLPEIHWVNGWAEIVKMFLIADAQSWNNIKNYHTIPRDINSYLLKSIALKNVIVDQDFKEKGNRKILNFGHTIGHALESFYLNNEKNALLHGEAVALGMIVETAISVQKCGLKKEYADEIITYLKSIYTSVNLNENDIDSLIQIILHDKKNESGVLLFSLIQEPGYAVYNVECGEKEVRDVLLILNN